MTRLAPSAAIRDVIVVAPGPDFADRIRRLAACTAAALQDQSRLTAIRPETLRDTGLSADDLTGVPSYDPALPFFLQSGFGRRSR